MGEVELEKSKDLFFGRKEFGVLIYSTASLSSDRVDNGTGE